MFDNWDYQGVTGIGGEIGGGRGGGAFPVPVNNFIAKKMPIESICHCMGI